MKNRRTMLLLAAMMVIGLLVCPLSAQGEAFGPVQKNLATDFTYYDVDGNAATLRDLRGLPVIVNFFASWCGPCKSEMPYLDEAAHAYDGQVRFLMVDMNAFGGDTPEAVFEMMEEGGYTFDVYFDTDGEGAIAYRVSSIPTTLFIAADGELLGQHVGAMTEDMLAKGIQKVLAGEK